MILRSGGIDFGDLGWSVGGFDAVLLRDGTTNQSLGNGSHNTLALDSIEMSDAQPQGVPEPGTLELLGIALLETRAPLTGCPPPSCPARAAT